MKKILSLVLSGLLMFSLVACSENTSNEEQNSNSQQIENQADLWADATYTEDTEIGEGKNTVNVIVVCGEKQITITLKTDQTNFGTALLDSGLVQGADGDYGLYISHVNGIKAVYEEDSAYWAFHGADGGYMSYGVEKTELSGNDTFQLIYTLA